MLSQNKYSTPQSDVLYLFTLLQNLGQELDGTGFLRIGKKLLRNSLFHDLAVCHEDNAVAHLAGKAISWVTTTMVIPS